MNMRTILVAAGLALLLSLGTACPPRLIGPMIMAAAIVGTVAILAHHDAHYHDAYCGHHRRYYEGRWVYYYGDHWEYYDPYRRVWYYYEE